MKKIFLIGLVIFALAVMGGCASTQESLRNTNTIHGTLDRGVKLKKSITYKVTYHELKNLFLSFSSDIVSDDIAEPNEKQKKFVDYFIRATEEEFKKRNLILIKENIKDEIVLEIKITYLVGKPTLLSGWAGSKWILNGLRINRMVVVSAFGLSTDETIKEGAERLAREMSEEFFSIIAPLN